MNHSKNLIHLVSPFLIVIAAVLLRLAPHEPNVAPIGAMALFGGATLSKRYALVVPLIVMFISDLFLGFHSTMFWVYGSFVLIGLLGVMLRNKVNFGTVLISSVLASILFFLVTNFGVWVQGGMYQANLNGLLQSYIMGLPFFRNTLSGDLFFNAIFFGGFALIKSWSNKYVPVTVSNYQK